MFQFTPLQGAQSTSTASQSLLELDGGVKILVDVGWDERFDVKTLESLESNLSSISIILLTHATTSHLGAFAHCCKHFPIFQQIPIYATAPVISLGRTLLQDTYFSNPRASTVIPQASLAETSYSYQSSISDEQLNILLQPPSLEEISKYFALIHPLKYSQPHQPLPSPFSPPLNDLTITAYNAGHSLGGTIWHIQHGMESIVYAVDWNQVRENVFAGAAWLGGSGGGGTEVIEQLRKPTALVCSARGAEKNVLTGGRKKRDDILLDLIRSTTAKNGVVLIPTDSSARVLELAYILEHAWRKETLDHTDGRSLKRAKLYLASKTAGGTMRYVRSMLEWMDENVVKEFESDATSNHNRQHRRNESKQNANSMGNNKDMQNAGTSSSPFEFKFLKFAQNRKKIERILAASGPRVILASDSSLDWGFSKDILQRIAKDPSNLVILTDYLYTTEGDGSPVGGLYGTLCRWYQERRDGISNDHTSDGSSLEICNTNNREIHIESQNQKPLEGKELLIYQQYLATKRQSQGIQQSNKGAELETSADAVDETSSTSSSSSEESDAGRQGKALNVSIKTARFSRNKAEPGKEISGVNVLIRRPGVYDYDVRGKKGRDQMFPFLTKRRRGDDFGELIKPEDYLRAEERDDINGQDLRENGTNGEETVGQKRKWQDLRVHGDAKSSADVSNKRRLSRRPSNNDTYVGLNGYSNPVRSSSSEDSDDGEAFSPVPSKLETSTTSVIASLKIAHIDFSGIHDQRSLTMLIPLIKPKKLILIGGSPSETSYLAKDCNQKLGNTSVEVADEKSSSIFTPSVGQMIDASVDTNAWTVELSENLVRRFHWQKVRGLSVVTLMGLLTATRPTSATEDAISRKKQKLLDDNEEDVKPERLGSELDDATTLLPMLNALPANMAAATRSAAQPLHVGDLRLADLRKVLQASGHTAEFRGEGTLLIDGLVAVRKSGNGRVEIESVGRDLSDARLRPVEASFYAVKRKIYECLAVIAGG